MELYHGTTIDITDGFLKPHKAFETYDYKPAVYFADKFEIALLYTTNPIKAYLQNQKRADKVNAFCNYFKVDEKENKVIVSECYAGMLEEVYDRQGYIYTFNCDSADKHKRFSVYEFLEPVVFDKKLLIPNVLSELEKSNNIIIKRFNDLSFVEKRNLYDSISERANACESQGEVDYFKEKFKGIDSIQNFLRLRT